MKNSPLILIFLPLIFSCGGQLTPEKNCGTITHEGYNYSTVVIGDQCWFAENCRYLPEVSPSSPTSHDGMVTVTVTDQNNKIQWAHTINTSPSAPYYYVYDYQGTDVTAAKSTKNYETYGVLYNWPAVMKEGICPSGWHIPSDEEFTQLTDFLGGEDVAGGKMKEVGFDHWDSPNTGATNSSGFTGLPGGAMGGRNSTRNISSGFHGLGGVGNWWSASNDIEWMHGVKGDWSTEADHLSLVSVTESFYRITKPYYSGRSARCVRDEKDGEEHEQSTYTYTYANGDKYVGGWYDSVPHGQGTLTWSNGDKYVGGWKDGVPHGQGTKTWLNGDKFLGEYVGGWKDGKRHGTGINYWSEASEYHNMPIGSKYNGQWLNDKKHGYGKATYADGTVEEGLWNEGDFIK